MKHKAINPLEFAAYWDMPNDGATFKCDCGECGDKQYSYNEMIMTETPNGMRHIINRNCVDEYWLSIAKYMGKLSLD